MGMATAGIHGVERSAGDNWDCCPAPKESWTAYKHKED